MTDSKLGRVRAAILMALFAVFGCGGCTEKRGHRETTLQPAACEEQVDLHLFRQSDGTTAGVYVLKTAEVTLFVPKQWFPKQAYQGWDPHRPNAPSPFSIEPLLNYNECVGRVHRLESRTGMYLHMRIPGLPDILPKSFPVHSIVVRRINKLSSARASDEPNAELLGPEDEFGWAQVGKGDAFIDTIAKRHGQMNSVESAFHAYRRNGHSGSAMDRWPNNSMIRSRDLALTFNWQEAEVPQPQWRELQDRIRKLAEWLETPPANRSPQPHV